MKLFTFVATSLFLLFTTTAFSQLQLHISTDKPLYSYGEKITITAAVKNISDSSFSIIMSSYESCQAEFQLNAYSSKLWGACLPTTETLNFVPNEERIYKWEIEPKIFGLPNKDGTQKLIGTFSGVFNNNNFVLIDSTEFTAPLFKGGQIDIAYNINDSTKISTIRDSLNAQVINTKSSNGTKLERWQISGIPIDPIFDKYKNDARFNYVELVRNIGYSQIITDVIPGNLPNNFALFQNYPNPFNPTTVIKYSVLVVQTGYLTSGRQVTPFVQLKIYDVLGHQVVTLVNKKQAPGNYQIQFNASGLPSGIYFYKLQAGNFTDVKKMILLK